MRGEIITREEMLAIPAIEISDLGRFRQTLWSACLVITYNHEAYIEQTIEGILAQQCDFPIELIIGEDKSQDRTLEICLEYQKKYPQLIRIVTWHENVGVNANPSGFGAGREGSMWPAAKVTTTGSTRDKLAKQVALMEQFPDTMLCGALVRMLDDVKGNSDGECSDRYR